MDINQILNLAEDADAMVIVNNDDYNIVEVIEFTPNELIKFVQLLENSLNKIS
jgi:hypothetical protein